MSIKNCIFTTSMDRELSNVISDGTMQSIWKTGALFFPVISNEQCETLLFKISDML